MKMNFRPNIGIHIIKLHSCVIPLFLEIGYCILTACVLYEHMQMFILHSEIGHIRMSPSLQL